jgi:hypothetical protein
MAAGCRSPSVSPWTDPSDLLMVSSRATIERGLKAPLAWRRDANSCLTFQDITVGERPFLVAIASPYRGITVKVVYVFEFVEDLWYLRAVAPAYDGDERGVKGVARDDALDIESSGDVILTIHPRSQEAIKKMKADPMDYLNHPPPTKRPQAP